MSEYNYNRKKHFLSGSLSQNNASGSSWNKEGIFSQSLSCQHDQHVPEHCHYKKYQSFKKIFKNISENLTCSSVTFLLEFTEKIQQILQWKHDSFGQAHRLKGTRGCSMISYFIMSNFKAKTQLIQLQQLNRSQKPHCIF